jgi:putative peptidoglycan lipid II flippase
MGLAAAVSRAFGALRVLVIAAVLGTTYLGNAFQSSNSVSNVLFELLAAGALSAVLVPTFVQHLDSGDRAGAESLARELLGVAVVVLGAVSLVGVLASGWIADLLTAAVEDPSVRAAQRDLSRFLLWFFIPQVLLYAWGSISTAVLHAQRRFVVPAVAPIGNTLVMVGFLGAFAVVAGSDPGLELSSGEKLLLAGAGTLGVLAFVAIPTVAAWRDGFRLVPRFTRSHEGLPRIVSLSGWAGLQHAVAASLLGAAIVAGGAVEGGVVAYQVGWFFFLAPYGIIAQPIHTAILPELVHEHAAGEEGAFETSVRWSLDSMAVLLAPLSALCVALAVPAMSVLAFGQADTTAGVELLAAALAGLCLGLVPYGAFFLLARAWYVLEDSRRPAVAGICGAAVGVAAMGLSAWLLSGAALVAGLGLAHTLAFCVAAGVLVVGLHRRTGTWVVSGLQGGCLVAAVLVGIAAWGAHQWWAPAGRGLQLVELLVLSGIALGAYAAMLRLGGVSVRERLRVRSVEGRS